MSDAAEKIWITQEPIAGYECWDGCLLFDTKHEEGYSYTRTDIAQARIAELEAALLLCADYLDQDKPRSLAEEIARAALKETK